MPCTDTGIFFFRKISFPNFFEKSGCTTSQDFPIPIIARKVRIISTPGAYWSKCPKWLTPACAHFVTDLNQSSIRERCGIIQLAASKWNTGLIKVISHIPRLSTKKHLVPRENIVHQEKENLDFVSTSKKESVEMTKTIELPKTQSMSSQIRRQNYNCPILILTWPRSTYPLTVSLIFQICPLHLL